MRDFRTILANLAKMCQSVVSVPLKVKRWRRSVSRVRPEDERLLSHLVDSLKEMQTQYERQGEQLVKCLEEICERLGKAIVTSAQEVRLEYREGIQELVTLLKETSTAKHPRRSAKGLWADLGIDITEDDITQARREMWGNFPREDI